MSAVDYAKMSTDELIQKFIDAAKITGSVFGLKSRLDKESLLQAALALHAGHSEARVQEMQALGAELRRREPIAKLRRLFDDQHPDVRGWAGAQFLSVDPDSATATLTGLSYNVSAREVLAWRDRILRGVPKRPRPDEMTVPQLVDRFVDACERCYGSTRFLTDEQGGGPSMKAYNKVSGEPYAVAKELNARGELATLVPLLDHPLVTVREKAGMYCLDIATDKAIAALQAISGVDSRHEAAEGSTILGLWRMGKYKPLSE
ncbi:MAG: DUF2019 domain-containing protein [Xanthobacteraceae bacterium]|jgi:hypothetical protein